MKVSCTLPADPGAPFQPRRLSYGKTAGFRDGRSRRGYAQSGQSRCAFALTAEYGTSALLA